MKKVFIIIGSPYSGQTTQADLLAKHYGFTVISRKRLIRAAIESKTEKGLLALASLKKGKAVPEDIVADIVWKEFQTQYHTAEGFIFDGFPRTISEAEMFERMLSLRELKLDAIFWLDDMPLERLFERQTKKYEGIPTPKKETTTLLRKRKCAYIHLTHPMLAHYEKIVVEEQIEMPANIYNTKPVRKKGLVYCVFANRDINAIHSAIKKHINQMTKKQLVY